MPTHFTPQQFLRQVPNSLLQAYFAKRNQLTDLPWDQFRETEVESIHEAILQLHESDRRAIGAEFRAVAEMGQRKAISTLMEVARDQGVNLAEVCPAMSSTQETAFWTFLNHPDLFEEARAVAHWLQLPKRSMEKRNGLPTIAPDVTADTLARFAGQLTDYFQRHQGRGEHCQVEHLLRAGHIDFFFAYPADYADIFIGYEEDGNFARRQWKPAFEVIVAFDRTAGTLDIYAEGPGLIREEIAKIFTREVLRHDAEPQRIPKPPYNLQLLLEPGLQFPAKTEDNLKWFKVRALRLQKPNSIEKVTFDVGSGEHTRDIHALLDETLDAQRMPRQDLLVTQAILQAGFETGRKRPKSITFTITQPSGCTLGDSDEELTLRRYLKEWKIAS